MHCKKSQFFVRLMSQVIGLITNNLLTAQKGSVLKRQFFFGSNNDNIIQICSIAG